jgi:hypothetical protein
MKIYLAHSISYDFLNELYNPIKNSALSQEHDFVFPHDKNNKLFPSKEFFKNNCDLVIAEGSHPSTGMGIELGWANMLNLPIICVYKKGSKVSNSLKAVTDTFLEYANADELVAKIAEVISKIRQAVHI